MSNRVEELESQVAELQAAVDGLTEELVETRERLRELEDDAETVAERGRNERGISGEADAPTTAESDGDAAAEGADGESEPDAEAEPEAETDDESSSGTDEIIVA